jgi:hypothetical protein
MGTLVVVLLFAIFCILGLMLMELRCFVQHVCVPQLPMYTSMPPQQNPCNRDDEQDDETVGFKPTKKKDE